MVPAPKIRRLSVRYQPLKGKTSFDIQKPALPAFGERPAGVHFALFLHRRGFGYFVFLSLSLFFLFLGLGLYTGAADFFLQNRNLAFAGYERLKEGTEAAQKWDFSGARQFFDEARNIFQDLSDRSVYLTHQASRLFKNSLYLGTAQKLIESGQNVSSIGLNLARLMESAKSWPRIFVLQNLDPSRAGRLTDAILRQRATLDQIHQDAGQLADALNSLNSSVLPYELRSPVSQATEQLARFLPAIEGLQSYFGTFLRLLGHPTPHRYLVLFQNHHELRATGGFIGSYLLADVNDGAISAMEFRDVYDTDGQLLEQIQPPPGIDRVSDRFYMRDANYSPDFPTSARQILWFLEHSRGPTADTVIAIDQTAAEELLKITGPIRLSGLPSDIRSENFSDLLSFQIESKRDGILSPKRILSSLIPAVKDRLLKSVNPQAVFSLVRDLSQRGAVQIYSVDDGIQALARRFHLDGTMTPPALKTDFLALISTSIGGNKSDAFIRIRAIHQTTIGPDGLATDRLILSKTHMWKEEDFALWQSLADQYGTGKLDLKTLRFIHGEGGNLDYLRIYVPKGSRLVTLVGVDPEQLRTSEDLGYTVFAFPFGPVMKGEERQIEIVYRLPFALDTARGDVYRFIARKQAGSDHATLRKSVRVHDSLKIAKTYPETGAGAFTLYPEYATRLDSDKVFLSAIVPAAP